MQTLGNFEKLATQYHNSRQGFVEETFTILENELGGLHGKNILDVGCGTGIATRELVCRGARVTGTDISSAMLDEAKQLNPELPYLVAPTDNLPFSDGEFNGVTAFSAFHWFCDNASVNEIKRVLKPAGVLAVINKNDVSGIRKDVTQLFNKYVAGEVIRSKKEYHPEEITKQAGFKDIKVHSIPHTETFSFDSAIEYLQSIALWNQISNSDTSALLEDIKHYCRQILDEKGSLERQLETVVLIARK